MSAWIVDKEHIIYMVKAWELNESRYSSRTVPAEELAEICTMLYWENAKSVGYRYSKRYKREDYVITPEEYTACQWDCIEWPQVMKSISCYEYQSCEHKGWEKSKAKAWTAALYRTAGSILIEKNSCLIWGAPTPLALLPV